MPKLTETFTDKLNGAASPEPAEPHVVEAHEPLGNGEGWRTYTGFTPLHLVPSQSSIWQQAVEPAPTPPPEPKPLKIALIGTAPSSRMLAPFKDTSWTIWACSPGNMNALPRYDAWFEIHSNLLWPEHAQYGPPYIEWLKTLKCPVYMQDQSQVPNAVSFPWRELVVEFGEDFFTSSFAWMMAYAIKMGASEIALYGIDMASRDEYILQRPGFFFFRHLAQQRGIKVTAPNESDIMQSPPLYAISDSTPFGRKILAREKEIKDRVAQMTVQRDQLASQIVYLQGALEDCDYFKSIWTGAQRPS